MTRSYKGKGLDVESIVQDFWENNKHFLSNTAIDNSTIRYGIYYTKVSNYWIAPSKDKKVKLVCFDRSSNASDFLHGKNKDENIQTLNALYQEHKEKFHVVKNDVRHLTNQVRQGIDYRQGADISPDEFMETFGIAGGQFGNWVKGKERNAALNNAYDAFMDLARVLDIDPKKIGLDGNLSIAFGARGKSKACAHYEIKYQVINLTKNKGAGSLAHEWFHALDHYINKFGDRLASDRNVTRSEYLSENHWEFLKLKDAICYRTDFEKRSVNADNTGSYFSKPEEMLARAFESVVKYLLKDAGCSNDFLVNFIDFDDWQKDESIYPYLKSQEMAKSANLYKSLIQKVLA